MIKIKGSIKQILAELLMLPSIDEGKVYICQLKLFRERRSLTANAYYWNLLQEYAAWAGKSDVYVHNDVLEHYGQDMIIDTETNERATTLIREDLDYHELTEIHLRGTSKFFKGANGAMYRVCVVRRGSHSYDTAEFSRIIDGLIEMIQGSGAPIQTLSPVELQKLKGYGYKV